MAQEGGPFDLRDRRGRGRRQIRGGRACSRREEQSGLIGLVRRGVRWFGGAGDQRCNAGGEVVAESPRHVPLAGRPITVAVIRTV